MRNIMPIPIAKLQERPPSLTERILEVLRKDPSQAYNEVELYGTIHGLSDSALALFMVILLSGKNDGRRAEIREALKSLERDGLVQAALHNGTTYYAIK